jgi:hypothetical protein
MPWTTTLVFSSTKMLMTGLQQGRDRTACGVEHGRLGDQAIGQVRSARISRPSTALVPSRRSTMGELMSPGQGLEDALGHLVDPGDAAEDVDEDGLARPGRS